MIRDGRKKVSVMRHPATLFNFYHAPTTEQFQQTPVHINPTRNQQSPDLLSDERLKKSASLCRYSGQDTS